MNEDQNGDYKEKGAEIDKIIRRFGDNLRANKPLQDGLEGADPENLEAANMAAGSILVGFDMLDKLDRSVQEKVLFASVLTGTTQEEAEESYGMFLMHEVIESLAILARRES